MASSPALAPLVVVRPIVSPLLHVIVVDIGEDWSGEKLAHVDAVQALEGGAGGGGGARAAAAAVVAKAGQVRDGLAHEVGGADGARPGSVIILLFEIIKAK